MNVLVTGGAGYIGSHVVVELLEADHDVIIIDNLANSSEEVLAAIKKITGKEAAFHNVDMTDEKALRRIFEENNIDAVIHLAGLKAVGESAALPLKYYRTNIGSSITLCELMLEYGVNKFVFSSSATVYGTPQELPLSEESPVGQNIANPYGQTKYMIEQILTDVAAANADFEVSLLRYFNPLGAHESGLIGDNPQGKPNNIMPYIAKVAVGDIDVLEITGGDYDTPDGTGARDYIHVVDLAKGHVAALDHLKKGVSAYNLGSGNSTTVLELVKAFEEASGQKVPYTIVDRRPGDLPEYYSDASKAKKELNWVSTKTIEEMCADTWNWQSSNAKREAQK